MKQMIETICKSLVDDPKSISIKEMLMGDVSVYYEIKVKKADIGKVIGKKGASISALRLIMKNIAARQGKKIKIELVEA